MDSPRASYRVSCGLSHSPTRSITSITDSFELVGTDSESENEWEAPKSPGLNNDTTIEETVPKSLDQHVQTNYFGWFSWGSASSANKPAESPVAPPSPPPIKHIPITQKQLNYAKSTHNLASKLTKTYTYQGARKARLQRTMITQAKLQAIILMNKSNRTNKTTPVRKVNSASSMSSTGSQINPTNLRVAMLRKKMAPKFDFSKSTTNNNNNNNNNKNKKNNNNNNGTSSSNSNINTIKLQTQKDPEPRITVNKLRAAMIAKSYEKHHNPDNTTQQRQNMIHDSPTITIGQTAELQTVNVINIIEPNNISASSSTSDTNVNIIVTPDIPPRPQSRPQSHSQKLPKTLPIPPKSPLPLSRSYIKTPPFALALESADLKQFVTKHALRNTLNKLSDLEALLHAQEAELMHYKGDLTAKKYEHGLLQDALTRVQCQYHLLRLDMLQKNENNNKKSENSFDFDEKDDNHQQEEGIQSKEPLVVVPVKTSSPVSPSTTLEQNNENDLVMLKIAAHKKFPSVAKQLSYFNQNINNNQISDEVKLAYIECFVLQYNLYNHDETQSIPQEQLDTTDVNTINVIQQWLEKCFKLNNKFIQPQPKVFHITVPKYISIKGLKQQLCIDFHFIPTFNQISTILSLSFGSRNERTLSNTSQIGDVTLMDELLLTVQLPNIQTHPVVVSSVSPRQSFSDGITPPTLTELPNTTDISTPPITTSAATKLTKSQLKRQRKKKAKKQAARDAEDNKAQKQQEEEAPSSQSEEKIETVSKLALPFTPILTTDSQYQLGIKFNTRLINMLLQKVSPQSSSYSSSSKTTNMVLNKLLSSSSSSQPNIIYISDTSTGLDIIKYYSNVYNLPMTITTATTNTTNTPTEWRLALLLSSPITNQNLIIGLTKANQKMKLLPQLYSHYNVEQNIYIDEKFDPFADCYAKIPMQPPLIHQTFELTLTYVNVNASSNTISSTLSSLLTPSASSSSSPTSCLLTTTSTQSISSSTPSSLSQFVPLLPATLALYPFNANCLHDVASPKSQSNNKTLTKPVYFRLSIQFGDYYPDKSPLRLKVSPTTHVLALKATIIEHVLSNFNLVDSTSLTFDKLDLYMISPHNIKNDTTRMNGEVNNNKSQNAIALSDFAPFDYYVNKFANDVLLLNNNNTDVNQIDYSSVFFKIHAVFRNNE